MILTYDPGSLVGGVALWEGAELTSAYLVRGGDWNETAAAAFRSLEVPIEVITDVVIERPQVYVQRRLKGDPNDLITVAMNAAALASRFYGRARVTEYRPRQWKGTVAKGVAIKRFQARLSSEERERVNDIPRSLAHNVWDAVGLGLYHVGRR